MSKFSENMETARNKALELAKKLGVDYDPPQPPSEDDIKIKTELYFSVMANKSEIDEILSSITDAERAAYKNKQNSKK